MAITQINIKIIDRFENDRVLHVEQTQKSAPVLTYNGADDKYQPIMASEFSANLLVSDKTDGKFFHLYTGNEKRYYCLVEDQDNNMIWDGYLLPDFYSEPYTNNAFFVEFTATDGLGLLKGKYLENEYYKKETSAIKLIAECLKLTQLDKPIYFSPAIESAATDYRWDEIAVNGYQYLDDPDADWRISTFALEVAPKRKSAYEILELLLTSLGCTLYCQGEYWYVEGINRKHETSQYNQLFTKDGVYVESQTLTKDVKDLVFLENPTISVLSPWRYVNVSWDCNEDGNLIPEWAIKDIQDSWFQNHKKDLFDFWTGHGIVNIQSVSKELRFIMQVLLGLGVYVGNEEPRNLLVNYVVNNSGLNPANINSNYVDIKNRKYLKITDEYIERIISIDFRLLSQTNTTNTDPQVPLTAAVEESDLATYFKYDLNVGDNTFLSSKLPLSDIRNKRVLCKKINRASDEPVTTGNLDRFIMVPYHTDCKLVETEVDFTNNGFFNLKLYPPLSLVYTIPWHHGYVVNEMNCTITALATWYHVLERNIDFSTVYDLEIFHGDSIADLTEKQWRFRRFIPEPEDVEGSVTILSSYISYGQFFNSWVFIISQSEALMIQNNYQLLNWTISGIGTININDTSLNDTNGSSNWQVTWSVGQQPTGEWTLIIIPNAYYQSIGFSAFQSGIAFVDVDGNSPFFGWVPEDNEWRESWKRYGKTEILRYGVALGKIYHDVQAGATPILEGDVLSLVFPRDIGRFQWMDVREFIPTRLTINFNEGKTNLYLIDSTIENVVDYIV